MNDIKKGSKVICTEQLFNGKIGTVISLMEFDMCYCQFGDLDVLISIDNLRVFDTKIEV